MNVQEQVKSQLKEVAKVTSETAQTIKFQGLGKNKKCFLTVLLADNPHQTQFIFRADLSSLSFSELLFEYLAENEIFPNVSNGWLFVSCKTNNYAPFISLMSENHETI